jgi:outer membrane immunogenic protein
MNKCIVALAAALVLMTSNAAADGLMNKSHVRDTSHVDAPHIWRGVYVGLHAGLANGNTQGKVDPKERDSDEKPSLLSKEDGIGPFTFDYEMTGALYGGQIGWPGQWGQLVAGVEASYSGSSVQGSDAGCLVLFVGVDCRRDVNWLATVVGRAGWAYDRILIYGLAGVAWADVDTQASVLNTPFLSGSETHVGWTVGFGLEWALSNRVSARIEYAHIDLGDETHQLSGKIFGHPITIPDKVALEMDTIRLGINVKLGH